MAFTLESPAFHDGEKIPDKYARKGRNLSPPLIWKDAPQGTKSFIVVVEDPDAPSGIFRHWGVYDIDPECDGLLEGAVNGEAKSLVYGINDFGNSHYDGPQPPKGHGIHHYHFRLAALDVKALHCGRNAKISDLLERARPHIIAETELVGTYENR